MTSFKMKKDNCGLCNQALAGLKGNGIMQYRCEDEEGQQQLMSMAICKECADLLDGKIAPSMSVGEMHLTTDDIRDRLLRK